MTKNVQCRNGYVNHWEVKPPYSANYEFSSTEHVLYGQKAGSTF